MEEERMKNFLQYWSRLCSRSPQLYDEDVKMNMSVKSFKAQLEKAYKQGAEDMRGALNDFEKVGDKKKSVFDALDDVFTSIFGDKK